MLVFFCIAIIILNLLAGKIRIGANVYFDLFGNDGFIKLYLFGIRIFKAELNFEHDADKSNNIIISHGKKRGKIHLNTDTNDKKSVAFMMKNPIMENILVEKISAHFIVGRNNNSFFTVGILQLLRVVFYAMLAPLKCRYSVKITESFTPIYNKDILQTDFIGIIGVSIADIIVSCVANILKKNKKLREQEVATV